MRHRAGWIFAICILLFLGITLAADIYNWVTVLDDPNDTMPVTQKSDADEIRRDCENRARVRYRIGVDYEEDQTKLLRQEQKDLAACSSQL